MCYQSKKTVGFNLKAKLSMQTNLKVKRTTNNETKAYTLSIFLYTLVNMLLQVIYLYRQYLCSTDTLFSAANLLKGYAQDTNRLERDLL
jgi:hypothetical protein